MISSKIDLEQDIQPLSEFRKHAAEYIERIKNDKRPLIITQHGKSAAVLLDVNSYQKMLYNYNLNEELIEAERQISRDETLTHQDAILQVKENLKKWK